MRTRVACVLSGWLLLGLAWAADPVVSDSVVQDGYPVGTNIITASPHLEELRDNGGATQTIPILAGSSAIGAPDTVTYTTAEATSWVDGGLTPNTQYAMQVAATNATGDRAKTATFTLIAWPLAATPLAPIVSNPGSGRVDVGLDASDGNPADTEYAIEVTPAVSSCTWLQTDGSPGTAECWRSRTAPSAN